jgi:flagellar secretion chaperone FliS
MKNPALAYRQISVQGATPLGLVVMLYDGAIAALERAVVAIGAGDISEKCQHVARAQAIILQLEGTLNFAAGGEVAQTLKALYVYARGQILKANLENSPQILRSLIDRITPVREAWNVAEHRAPDNAPTAERPYPTLQPEVQLADPDPGLGRTDERFAYPSLPEMERPSRRFSA